MGAGTRWTVTLATAGILMGIGAVAWACVPGAQMRAQPDFGPPEAQVTVQGEGFPARPVDVHWGSARGPVVATAQGPDFAVGFSVPNVEDGVYTIVAVPQEEEVADGEPSSPAYSPMVRAPFEVTADGTRGNWSDGGWEQGRDDTPSPGGERDVPPEETRQPHPGGTDEPAPEQADETGSGAAGEPAPEQAEGPEPGAADEPAAADTRAPHPDTSNPASRPQPPPAPAPTAEAPAQAPAEAPPPAPAPAQPPSPAAAPAPAPSEADAADRAQLDEPEAAQRSTSAEALRRMLGERLRDDAVREDAALGDDSAAGEDEPWRARQEAAEAPGLLSGAAGWIAGFAAVALALAGAFGLFVLRTRPRRARRVARRAPARRASARARFFGCLLIVFAASLALPGTTSDPPQGPTAGEVTARQAADAP